MKKLLFIIFILYAVYALPKSVYAQTLPQQFLEVSPIINDITLIPGQTFTYPLTITNKGDKPVGFHVDITGIDPTEDGTSNPQALHSPLALWTSVKPADLIVAPHEKNTFKVSIATPKSAATSGYYATLYLTPFISNPKKNGGPVILERIGSLIFATVGALDYKNLYQKASIADFSFAHSFTGIPTGIRFEVKNSYFTHFIAKPFLTITTFDGKKKVLYPAEKHILPGSSRSWIYSIDFASNTLYVQADLAISVGNGYQVLAHTTYINYRLILFIVLGICLVLFIFKRIRQLKKAFKILFTGKP